MKPWRDHFLLLARYNLWATERLLEQHVLTLTEAAYLLGYSELSAFSRAFQRWTGTTAVAYRNRAKSA